MTADNAKLAAPAPSARRRALVRTTRLPGDQLAGKRDPLAHLPALVAELHAAAGSHLTRADVACRALRDAPVSTALAVRIARTAPEFAAALALAFDCADESDG